MNDSELIAAFLAQKSITKVAAGKRALTEHQMRVLTGPEPIKQIKYEILLLGEDGMEFTVEETAKSANDARTKAREAYPESRIISIELYGTHSQRAYDEANTDW
jgi:hypothetical protein